MDLDPSTAPAGSPVTAGGTGDGRGITAIVCDFGGVLTSPLHGAFLAIEDSTGVSPADFGVALGALAERSGINPLFLLERGEISEADFLEDLGAQLSTALGRGVSMHGFGDCFIGNLRPNVQMIDYMGNLRGRGYRMAMCTNNVREWEALWRPKLPVDEIFEVVVDSAFVGTRKPERDIYEITLDRLGVEPADALFVDDMEINCDAARELGMGVVHFRTTEQALTEIESALGRGQRSAD